MRRSYYQRESLGSSEEIVALCFMSAVGALVFGGLAEVFFDGWIVKLGVLIGAIFSAMFCAGPLVTSGKCSRAEEGGNGFFNNCGNCGRIPSPPEEDINDQI